MKIKDKGDVERKEDVAGFSLNKSMETEAVSFIVKPSTTSGYNLELQFEDQSMDTDQHMDIDQEPCPEPFQLAPTTSGCQRCFPRHYQDFLPNFGTHIPHMPPKPKIPRNPTPAPPSDTEKSPTPPPDTQEPSVHISEPDEFGLYRVYMSYPKSDPDSVQDLTNCCDAPSLATTSKSNTLKWWAGFGRNLPELTRNAWIIDPCDLEHQIPRHWHKCCPLLQTVALDRWR